jgi:hypothetical protein
VAQLPTPLNPSLLEGLKDDPVLYNTIKTIVDKFNATISSTAVLADFSTMPTGPRSVTATQLGGTIQINFGSDLGASPIEAYVVYRADAGTRSAPTTPVVSAAQIVATVPVQDTTCLIGTGYASGTYTWIDRNFTITELDPANPARKSYWVASIDNQNRISIAIQATSTPIEVVPNGPGDQGGTDPSSGSGLNKLYNSWFKSNAGALSTGVQLARGISAASNANPIQITTSTNHGFSNNDRVQISLVQGNTAANGIWTITFVDASNFKLNGSIGNGVFVAGQSAAFDYTITGEPEAPSIRNPDGSPQFTTWFSTVGGGGGVVTFFGDGTNPTGEVQFQGPTNLDYGELRQSVVGNYFNQQPYLCLSIYARIKTLGTAAIAQHALVMQALGSTQATGTFNGSLLTTSYQRFVWSFRAPNPIGGIPTGLIRISFLWQNNSGIGMGTGTTILVRQPMLSLGVAPIAWTPQYDTTQGTGNTSSTVAIDVQPSLGRTPVAGTLVRDPSVIYA